MGSASRCKVCEAPIDGRTAVCRDCTKERARRRRDALKARVDALKLERSCEGPDCCWEGSFEPEMLEFDHVRGVKEFTIASNLGRKWDVLLAEIAKCDVLCSNCHRLRHLRDKKTKWRGTEHEMGRNQA